MLIVIRGAEIAFSEWVPDTSGVLTYYPMNHWIGSGENPGFTIPLTPFVCPTNLINLPDTTVPVIPIKECLGLPGKLSVIVGINTEVVVENDFRPVEIFCVEREGLQSPVQKEVRLMINKLGSLFSTSQDHDKHSNKLVSSSYESLFVFTNNPELRDLVLAALSVCPVLQDAVELAMSYFYTARREMVYTTIGNITKLLEDFYVHKVGADKTRLYLEDMRNNLLRKSVLKATRDFEHMVKTLKLNKKGVMAKLPDYIAEPWGVE